MAGTRLNKHRRVHVRQLGVWFTRHVSDGDVVLRKYGTKARKSRVGEGTSRG